jgi:hypothetical protein
MAIRLSRCIAVTKGGCLVDIDAFSDNGIQEDVFAIKRAIDLHDSPDGWYYIILGVNPFKRIPVGSSDLDEKPPRNPFIIPEYTISVIEKQNFNIKEAGGYYLQIGLFQKKDDRIFIENNYIPPCSSVSSHENLINFFNKLSEFWSKLEKDIIQIIGKIHLKRQQSTLSASVHHISEKILSFVSVQATSHKWHLLHQEPSQMLVGVVQMARLIRNAIEILPHMQKEELINYYTDWCNLRTGEFEALLNDTVNTVFDQENMLNTLTAITRFLETLDSLYSTLSGLDYIGKRKQTGIFVKEEQSGLYSDDRPVNTQKDTPVRKSFLADE